MSARRPAVHVALLRGINVGGKNRLAMKDLAALLAELGCDDVRTLLQSGNVVYRAPAALAARLPRLVERALEERLGLRVPLVTRTAAELARVVAGNPFVRARVDPAQLHVAFLARAPARAAVAALEPDRSPPDEFVVRGREVYLRCPRGVARTRLTNDWFDARLSTTSTMRNWSTVSKLLELARGA